MNTARYRVLWCHLFLIAATTVGCKPNDPRTAGQVPVSGVVLLDGKPLSEAMIVFHNIKGDNRQRGSATTNENGHFKINTFGNGDGTLPGDYIVTVQKEIVTTLVSDEELLRREREALEIPEQKIVRVVPGKYWNKETSDVNVTVPEKGVGNLRIELTDSK